MLLMFVCFLAESLGLTSQVEVVGLTLTPRTLGARILLTTAQLGHPYPIFFQTESLKHCCWKQFLYIPSRAFKLGRKKVCSKIFGDCF
jgi:hypothetical protein